MKLKPTQLGIGFLMTGCLIAGMLISPLISFPPKVPEVNINLEPLYQEIKELEKKLENYDSMYETCKETEAADWEYINERCVCMFYSTFDTEPKTKDQICNAEEDNLYYWKGGEQNQ